MKGNPPSMVVNSSLEVPDQDFTSDARMILAVRLQVRRLRGGDYQAPSAPVWGGGTNLLALCPDFNSCSGSCNGCQRHARYGTIMPQLGLTQMASAAGSGDGDWPFLWPRLTGMAKPPDDPVFVVPLAACSTMKTIFPLFAPGVPPAHNLQAWDPRQAQDAHEAKEKRAKKQCQKCGHVWSVGLWKGLQGGTNLLALCPDFNSCSGSCNGCQRHARYGTIMPQLGLTQMASAAGSGDGD